MQRTINKSLLFWLAVLTLCVGCSQQQTPIVSPTSSIEPTVTKIIATSTSVLNSVPTSPSSALAVSLDEIPNISFDEYNSILGSDPIIPSQKMAISPDGNILAGVIEQESYFQDVGGNIFLWNQDSLDLSLKAFRSSISYLGSITFSDDGSDIAAGGCTQINCITSKIIIFDWTTGKVTHSLESDGGQIIQLKFTPDNRNLVAQDITGKISYWDLTARQVAHPALDHSQYAGAHGFAISPLGDKIAIATLDGIHLLDLPTFGPLEVRTGPIPDVGFGPVLALSPNGKQLIASGCGEFNSETCTSREIFIWSIEKSEPKRIIDLGKIFDYALTFNQNTTIFAFGGIGIKMWNASSGEEISSPYTSQSILVFDVIFNPNGKSFAALTDEGILLGEIAEDQSSWKYTTLDRLGIGRKFVITQAGDNLNFRTAPTINSPIQRKLTSGEIVTITFGPVSADGYVWWEVATQDNQTGWVVENADWYQPIP
jgi:hypothetical protein